MFPAFVSRPLSSSLIVVIFVLYRRHPCPSSLSHTTSPLSLIASSMEVEAINDNFDNYLLQSLNDHDDRITRSLAVFDHHEEYERQLQGCKMVIILAKCGDS
jgi:hypothetical protein